MTTMTQYQNLLTLRDNVFPVVFEKDKQGLVRFELYQSYCGTYGCLWGWYCWIALKEGGINSRVSPIDSKEHFGIGPGQDNDLFAVHAGTLQQRHTYLCNLIKEKEKELGINDKPLPNWQAMSQIPQAERLEAEVV